MTLRLVFGQDDLSRVRLTCGPDPMWELVLGLQKAQRASVPAPFLGWRQTLAQRLAGVGDGLRAVSLLRCLVAPLGDFPDFLTPPEPVADIDAGCEAVAHTPPARLTAELAGLFAHGPAPPWLRLLAGGDREQIGQVVRAVRTGHDLLIAPHWVHVREAISADRARRVRLLAAHGVGALLKSLPGVLSWDGHVLRTRYPEERTVHLAGRGLVLTPSFFCWGNPITWIDPELPPVLVYQAHGGDTVSRTDVIVPKRLVSLLGRTRAECLRLLVDPCSTSELAQHLGTSVGTASKHATVLRGAGLISSHRNGPAVLHSATPLGVALLAGSLPEL